MGANKPEVRTQLKARLLRLAKTGAAGGLVLASTTISVPGVAAAPARAEARPSFEERAAGVRSRLPELAADGSPPGAPESLLAWGNWGNWHNGWHNGWHNWHNWHNWW